jgi:hypothetical protein
MSYVFGLGAVTASVPFVSTPTLEGDGFASLFNAYKAAFPAGTTVTDFAKAVCAANGIRFTVAAIEGWIFGLSGKRFTFSASNNPGLGVGVGFAFFGAGNRILLPNIPRPGVVSPLPTTPPPPAPFEEPVAVVEKKSNLLFYAAGAGLLLLALLGGDKKKSGAAVSNATPKQSLGVSKWKL